MMIARVELLFDSALSIDASYSYKYEERLLQND